MTSAIEKSKPGTLAQYGSFDLEEMQETAEKLPTGGGNYYKPKQGVNTVRFLPPPQGKKAMLIWYKHFFQIGNERRAIVCAKHQYNEPCALCARGAKLRATGNKIDARKARAFEPQAQVYVNIVDMDNPEKGVQLWQMSQGLFKDITSAIQVNKVGKVFTDPVKGYNIVFKRKGEGMATEYSAHSVDRESSELPKADELLSTQMDLEGAEGPPSDEQVDEALDGEFEDRGGGKGGKGRGGGRGGEKRADPNYDDEEEADIET